MTLSLVTFFIVCPMAFVAGFVDAVAGGGGLITLPAFLLAGLPPHLAIGTNKLSSTMGTTVATIKYAREGFIPIKLAAIFAVCGLCASALGSNLSILTNEKILLYVLVVALPIIAFIVFGRKGLETDKKPYGQAKTIVIGIVVSLVIGFWDGYYGPGTGTFLIMAFVGIAHLPITTANGITKVINLSTNVAALVVMLTHGQVIIVLGLVAGLFNMVGNYLGACTFKKFDIRAVKIIIGVVLAAFFIKTIVGLIV